MTTVAANVRVRLAAHLPVHGGKVGTVTKRLVSSGCWVVALDERDGRKRQMMAVAAEGEMTVLSEGEQEGTDVGRITTP